MRIRIMKFLTSLESSGKFDRVFWILDVETNETDDFDFCKIESKRIIICLTSIN